MDDVQYIHGVAMDAIEEMYAFHPIKDRLVTRVESVGTKQAIFLKERNCFPQNLLELTKIRNILSSV